MDLSVDLLLLLQGCVLAGLVFARHQLTAVFGHYPLRLIPHVQHWVQHLFPLCARHILAMVTKMALSRRILTANIVVPAELVPECRQDVGVCCFYAFLCMAGPANQLGQEQSSMWEAHHALT